MSDNKSGSSNRILANLHGLPPELEKIYKDIHSHPELSMQEHRTAGVAAERLRDAGYEVTTGVGKTGVVGLLRNGEGATVMLRADMDALPVQEATGLPYTVGLTSASENLYTPGQKTSGSSEATHAIRSAPKLLAKDRINPVRLLRYQSNRFAAEPCVAHSL